MAVRMMPTSYQTQTFRELWITCHKVVGCWVTGYPLKDFLMATINNTFILIWRKDLIILTVKQEMSWHLKCSNPD